MVYGKRGTDKPIEIFIALFVILAVAMVILKMFSSQIEQKRTEMETQQQEERAKMAQADLDAYCDSQCSKAQRTLKDKVSYCTGFYRGEIDINKNSVADFTDQLDNIQGYCEDRIYCAAYRPCGSLDMSTCKKLTCDYMENTLGIVPDEGKADKLMGYKPDSLSYSGLVQPGDCWARLTGEQKKLHWFYSYMLEPDFMGNAGDKCFFRWGSCFDSSTALNQTYSAIWQSDCIPTTDDP